MGRIVIAEKPDQARQYQSAVGNRYGQILAARGHLFELAEPDSIKEEWKIWSVGIMRPDNGFYPTVLKQGDADIKHRYKAIRDAAKNADTILIATDPDREGEGIGGNILSALRRDIGWNGRVLRVLPLGADKKSMEKAFADARPIEEFKALYQSYVARSQADQIYNLSLTRSASVLFKPSGWKGPMSVGRVLTPTLGIVCRRERELANFKAKAYFLPWIVVEGGAGRVKLTHAPGEDSRLFERGKAEAIMSAAKSFQGPINVREERKKQAPPALFSLSKLQVEASRRFKWGVDKTTNVLQALYERHQVATYPRSSEVSLPEAEIENAPAMLAGILRLPAISDISWADAGPVIRRKKGAFSDADLKGAAHFAIVPNISTVDEWPRKWAAMNRDEQALFELIARRYLAAIGPDRVYDSTKQWIAVDDREFSAKGTVERIPGWREAMGAGQVKGDGEDSEEEGDSNGLPPFENGAPVNAVEHGVADKMTTPPPRYNQATLVAAMIEVWRLVENPDVRAVLKETDGIGTEATRSHVVKNLLTRNLIAPKDKSGALCATEAGMQFFSIIEKADPRLLDVGLTGEMELALEDIKSGKKGAKTVVETIVQIAQDAIDSMVKAKESGQVITARQQRPPSEKMKQAARARAKAKGEKLPSGVLSDFDKCRAYLGPMPEKGEGGTSGPRPPSEKQLALAQRIASESGTEVPQEALEDSAKISRWIDANMKKGSGNGAGSRSKGNGGSASTSSTGSGEPTSKQVALAEKLAKAKRLQVPDECFKDRQLMSRWIDTAMR